MGRVLFGIQAGRGVAALLVVLYHAERSLMLPQYVGHMPLGGVTGFGHAGVDFFFVLSGFIIYYVHHTDLGKPSALARYAGRRASRIYPPYWVVTAVLLLILIAAHGMDSVPSLASLGQIVLLTPSGQEPLLGVAWTLVREVEFYILFGFAIVDRRLAGVGIVAYSAVGWMPLPDWAAPLRFWGAGWYDLLFPIGIATAWITLHLSVPRARLWVLLGAAGFLAAGLAENARLLPAEGLPGRLAYGLASAIIIVGLATADRARRLRVGATLTLLGAASYSIYLVHSPTLGYAARALAVAGLLAHLPDWFAMAVVVVVAVGCGVGFHLWVERPLTAAAQRLVAQGHSATVGTSWRDRYRDPALGASSRLDLGIAISNKEQEHNRRFDGAASIPLSVDPVSPAARRS